MPRPRIHIPTDELYKLYHEENLSPARIGDRFGCNAITVRNRLKEAGIPLKTKSKAQTKYAKYDFSGSDTEKAYLLGFRYGDLNVYQPKGKSETIIVRSHSTHECQGDVFESLLSGYGKITKSIGSVAGRASIHMTCYLNMSFSFLLEKYPDEERMWLWQTNERALAFIAGYIDAEGTFGLNGGRGRFKIDAYDYLVLSDIHQYLLVNGVKSKFRRIALQGDDDYGWVWKHDVWRLEVNEAGSLEFLLKLIQPYMLHAKRITDANVVLQNIQERRLHGTIQ